MSNHALIHNFLQQQSVVTLPSPAQTPEPFTKAGIVPFIRRRPFIFYTMKPVARHRNLAAPEFQLCKGTRMYTHPELGWRDMREGDGHRHPQETLAETALREGIEELGLVTANIRQLFDLGSYDFASAVTGKAKKMWLFAAEMHSMDDFLSADKIEQSTGQRRWMNADEFEVAGRTDQRYILRDIETRISSYHAQ